MPETSDDVFKDLQRLAGVILFTVTVVDRKAGLARRCYSSHPDAYPVTGTKPIGNDGWSMRVLQNGQSFIANDTAGFAGYFSDHELINSLGCESAMNIPIAEGGSVVGTVNLLDVAGHFTPARVAELEALIGSESQRLVKAFSEAKL